MMLLHSTIACSKHKWRIILFIIFCLVKLWLVIYFLLGFKRNSGFNSIESWRLLDLSNFRYLLNNDVCDRNVFIVFAVISEAANSKRRENIRDSWGKPLYLPVKSRTMFFLGQPHTLKDQMWVEQEDFFKHDIVEGNFNDNRTGSLVYKTVMALKWIEAFCPSTKYVLLTRDDVFVDVYQLVRSLDNQKEPRPFLCYETDFGVIQYSELASLLVPYCRSSGYVLTAGFARKILLAFPKNISALVEDAYLVTWTAKIVGVKPFTLESHFTDNESYYTEWLQNDDQIAFYTIAKVGSNHLLPFIHSKTERVAKKYRLTTKVLKK